MNVDKYNSEGYYDPTSYEAIAASAASVIAMAGTKVIMSPVSMMMIHTVAFRVDF